MAAQPLSTRTKTAVHHLYQGTREFSPAPLTILTNIKARPMGHVLNDKKLMLNMKKHLRKVISSNTILGHRLT